MGGAMKRNIGVVLTQIASLYEIGFREFEIAESLITEGWLYTILHRDWRTLSGWKIGTPERQL